MTMTMMHTPAPAATRMHAVLLPLPACALLPCRALLLLR
jgi:hypothetical protein